MKRISCIFIVLSCLWVKNIHAATSQTFTFKGFSSLNKSDKAFPKNPSYNSLSTVDPGDSDQNPFSKKRKRGKRAIKPVLISVYGEIDFKIIDFEVDFIPDPQIFYFFRPYLCQGERAPPLLSIVS